MRMMMMMIKIKIKDEVAATSSPMILGLSEWWRNRSRFDLQYTVNEAFPQENA
jgi:hypothetical protein